MAPCCASRSGQSPASVSFAGLRQDGRPQPDMSLSEFGSGGGRLVGPGGGASAKGQGQEAHGQPR